MSRAEAVEDLAFLLYLIPFLGSGVYAVSLWLGGRFPSPLGPDLYLQVTKSPLVFLAGFGGVLAGAVVDVLGFPPEQRAARVAALPRRLQWLAAVSFLLALLTAWVAASGGAGLAGVGALLLEGRYTVLFPLLVLFESAVFSRGFLPRVAGFTGRETLGLLLLVLAPIALFAVSRFGGEGVVGGAVAAVLLLLGILSFLLGGGGGAAVAKSRP